MGIWDYVTDLYEALSVQETYAEEPQKDDGGDEGSDEGGEEKEESSEGGEGESDDAGEDGGDEGGDDEEEEEEEEEEEDEPEDPKPIIEENCLKTKECAPLKHHYDACAERVKHQEETHGKANEDCVEEYFHMMHCAAQCAAPKLFRQLK
ncbi:Cytochrome b-c1 complex subunit 6, mitochondrial [Fulvia fulva]|uniref:Cytochrome b-c1 complex subunit 6, mitochondrial n=1 Tax=Passalora fulva TaxID=5499 RepID=A0A9Q8LGT0_PASFU|nr:Cytochrome b-c1 complex subunit 6, mitochondrial [Fulvia fulva]KAK4624285.1 Cytochrome b-c1 complex subunit 6, mitochondrial [Fulvia fulva]KAK4625062.1 Cytochrome b-c1 complex subunit 6, mitochondrial [Fulvia fulva]UJO17361.1 Cytochrome b-c1 complex subunit 6, mitochondrial [Fulvia fulva]WPV14808.1 Cytochrome b-c1 complex subunit 6, mitochondrial [Fulvia fulva]WPV30102.1 Cytochrome b-c1 complex subunit 6, mitochondrial [Fulvia fulva]